MPATIIPSVELDVIEHDSERLVLEALRDQLDRRFHVFHSYRWLRPERGRARALKEGEADFVITHPDHGLLVLEVKGGTPELRGRQWYRGGEPLKDPFGQAQRGMHALRKEVAERSRGRLEPNDFVSGFAVVFPHCEYRGALPENADRAIILTQRHLSSMRDAIEEAFRRWTDRPRPLDSASFDCLREALTPETIFYEPLGPETDRAIEQLKRLTETQAVVVSAQLEAKPRLLVEGPAGSGKTELALRQAVRFANEGRRTLLVCFNRELALWLESRVQGDPTCAGLVPEQLTVTNYHRLVSQYVRRAGMTWPSKCSPDFWVADAADLLTQAAHGLGAEARFDAIIVDEAQDFRFDWWYSILEDLAASPDTPVQAFMDTNQCLWGTPERPPELEFQDPLYLDTNCRNTLRVAEFSSAACSVSAKTHRFAPEGRKTKIHAADSQSDQQELPLRRVKRFLDDGLTPDRIALIGPAAKERGSLADVDRIGSIPLTTSVADWRAGAGVLVTTARKFKGLEADAVVMYDLGALGAAFSEADLYVALTRAVYWLELVVTDSDMRARLRAAVDEGDLA